MRTPVPAVDAQTMDDGAPGTPFGTPLAVETDRGACRARLVINAAGTSAVRLLLQLDAAGVETAWSTRRPPEFTTRGFHTDWGRDVERRP